FKLFTLLHIHVYICLAPFLAAAEGKFVFKFFTLFGCHAFPFGLPIPAMPPPSATISHPETPEEYFGQDDEPYSHREINFRQVEKIWHNPIPQVHGKVPKYEDCQR